MPNSETDASVSNVDVPNRLKAKGAFQDGSKNEWIVRKQTEETEYPSLDGGHTLVKETKVTVSCPCAARCAKLHFLALYSALSRAGTNADKLARRQAQVHVLRERGGGRRRGRRCCSRRVVGGKFESAVQVLRQHHFWTAGALV